METGKIFDVIIIGGSYAGLSAAMALGRSLRNVMIIDSGKPCNERTPRSHNFLTQDGQTPKAISTLAKQQLEQYKTVKFYEGLAVAGRKINDGFKVTTFTGDTFKSKKLIFATGISDQMPDIKGFSDCWGISVIHCPYCHGYEYHQKKTGILANGDAAFHYAQLVSNLTDDLTIFTNGVSAFTPLQAEKLKQHNIEIYEAEIVELAHSDGHISNLVIEDGSQVQLEALYARVPFVQHCDIPASLNCIITEQGYIKTDGFQKTTVHGVYACGDSTNPMRSVANAVATGNLVGAMVNKEIVDEQF